jgi:hypothetical protein
VNGELPSDDDHVFSYNKLGTGYRDIDDRGMAKFNDIML